MRNLLIIAALAATAHGAFAYGFSRSSSGSWNGGSWNHSDSASWGNGNWNRSGSTSYTNRYGQTYSSSSSGSGSYNNGWHSGSGSYNTSWGANGHWSGSGYAYRPPYHYGTATYGGCYGSGFRVGYAAPAVSVTAAPVVAAPVVAAPVVAAPIVPAPVIAPVGVAAVRVGPFVRAGYYRRW